MAVHTSDHVYNRKLKSTYSVCIYSSYAKLLTTRKVACDKIQDERVNISWSAAYIASQTHELYNNSTFHLCSLVKFSCVLWLLMISCLVWVASTIYWHLSFLKVYAFSDLCLYVMEHSCTSIFLEWYSVI